MKAVIFAGGVGTRMWPVSRTKTPKQFEPLVGDKSTIELFYDQIKGFFKRENIYISTNAKYVSLLKARLPKFPIENLLLEPARRDLGPAVGYTAMILNQIAPREPWAVLWSDDIFKKPRAFIKVLETCENIVSNNPDQVVYIGQKPLFPDQNKGWIHRGIPIKHHDGISVYKFLGWHYRPPLETVKKYFRSGRWAVNTGDFVTTPQFVAKLYHQYAPEMFEGLQRIAQTWGKSNHQRVLKNIYPKLEKISVDDLISARVNSRQAVVLVANMGWYGFGDWQAIKEALQESKKDNIIRGLSFDRNSKDSLIYNYTNQLVTTIDLEGMLVVATKDAILVCPQESVPEIKKMLKDFEGTKLEKYT
jgi:mannose-1-phosphate guanylyltransferase